MAPESRVAPPQRHDATGSASQRQGNANKTPHTHTRDPTEIPPRSSQEDRAEDGGDHSETDPWHQEDGDRDGCAENIAEEEWDYSEWDYTPTNNVGPNWEYTGFVSRARSANNRYWS